MCVCACVCACVSEYARPHMYTKKTKDNVLPFEFEEADTNRVGEAVDTPMTNHSLQTDTPDGLGKQNIQVWLSES